MSQGRALARNAKVACVDSRFNGLVDSGIVLSHEPDKQKRRREASVITTFRRLYAQRSDSSALETTGVSMTLADEQKSLAVQAQAAAAKQGDTVRSLKASLKDGKAEKASSTAIVRSAVHAQSLRSRVC